MSGLGNPFKSASDIVLVLVPAVPIGLADTISGAVVVHVRNS